MTEAYLIKPACVGATGAALTYMRYPTSILNTRFGAIPLPLAAGGALFIASALAEVAHEYVLPHIPTFTPKMDEPAAAVVAVGANTVGTSAALYVANPDSINEIGLGQILALSAISEVAGDYIAKHFVNPLFA